MKSKTPLKAKTPLKSKTPLKAKAKPKKQTLPTLTALRKKADVEFAHYVRLRDADLIGNIMWQAECISCEKVYTVRWYDEDKQKWRWGRQEEAGHFVGRGNHYLRYSDENVNDQCTRCNKWKQGNHAAYHIKLDMKYGDGTANQLIELADIHKKYTLKRDELENVIKASKEYLEWAYGMEKQLNE